MHYCGNCGELLNDDEQVCSRCGSKCGDEVKSTADSTKANINFSKLSPYYQKEFQKIYESGEKYKGKFNVMGALFGVIWALTKGLWASCIKCIMLSIVTVGVGGIIYCILVYGFGGTYLYYQKYVKGVDSTGMD